MYPRHGHLLYGETNIIILYIYYNYFFSPSNIHIAYSNFMTTFHEGLMPSPLKYAFNLNSTLVCSPSAQRSTYTYRVYGRDNPFDKPLRDNARVTSYIETVQGNRCPSQASSQREA